MVSCGLIIPDEREFHHFATGRSRPEKFFILPEGVCLVSLQLNTIGWEQAMQPFYVKPGDQVTFAKTVGETDVYLFAGITGDFSVNHVNEQYMARSKYGRRIAHGALIVGYMSTCSTMMIEQCKGTSLGETPVSLGYDKVRFLGAVFIGDTITLTYNIAQVDQQKRQSLADIRVVNQRGDLVAVASHVLRWVKDA